MSIKTYFSFVHQVITPRGMCARTGKSALKKGVKTENGVKNSGKHGYEVHGKKKKMNMD